MLCALRFWTWRDEWAVGCQIGGKKMKGIFLILFFIFVILISGCSSTEILSDGHEATSEHLEEHEEEVHIHADFKVYVNDEAIDFSVPKYQLQAKEVHMEYGIGEEIHVHKEGITIGYFFETLGIEFDKDCIVIEDSYCSEDDKKLGFYVNGIENDEFESYEIKDLDKILISYGEGDIKEQLESITSLAARD